MPGVNEREVSVAFGYRPQADIATKNVDGALWRKTLLSTAPADFQAVTEDDANEKGKDDEFPTKNDLVNWALNGLPMEAYLSSQFFTWAAAMSVGTVVKSSPAAGVYQYVMTPQNPVSAGIDCPPFTFIERIRSSDYQNIALIGCAVDSWELNLINGPGKNNAKINVNALGTGRHENPFTGTFPAAVLEETFLNAGGASFTIAGATTTNYVTDRTIRSIKLGWAKGIDQNEMYGIGSGVQSGAQVGDRLEFTNRVLSLSFSATLKQNAPELAQLLSQEDCVITLGVTGPLITAGHNHSLSIVFHKARISARQTGTENGKIVVNCTIKALKHPTNGLFTVTTKTNVDNIGIAA